MSEELFKVPEQKSPRLRWMEKHRVKVKQTPDWSPGMEDADGDPVAPWYASDDGKHWHAGDSENDALGAWAVARGVRLWNEEQL